MIYEFYLDQERCIQEPFIPTTETVLSAAKQAIIATKPHVILVSFLHTLLSTCVYFTIHTYILPNCPSFPHHLSFRRNFHKELTTDHYSHVFLWIHASIFSSQPNSLYKSKALRNTIVRISTHSTLSLSAIFNFFVTTDHYTNTISFSQRKYFKIPMEDRRLQQNK